jgi:hypothetical protein
VDEYRSFISWTGAPIPDPLVVSVVVSGDWRSMQV